MWSDLKPAYRYPILILGMISLVIGTLAGIGRLGSTVPAVALQQAAFHGVLMIPAFFGTVIGLERAVAIGRRWAYLAPLLTGIGGSALIAGAPPAKALLLITVGSGVFATASLYVLRLQAAAHSWILFAGAVALLVGNILLIGGQGVTDVVFWWFAFLLLTIAGERLELSRFVIQSAAKRMALALLAVVPLLGALLEYWQIPGAIWIFALGMAGIGLWLLLFDIARRTVRMNGLTRFTAVCMLTGYFWLLASALLFIANETLWPGLGRGAPLHAFFLGFVFSMVIGHALIIFPAVTRLNMPYSALFYLPLIVLQASVLLRIIGELSRDGGLLAYGGIANGIALAVFILTLVGTIIRGLLGKSARSIEPTSSITQNQGG